MDVYWTDFLHGVFLLKEKGTGRLLGSVVEEVTYDNNKVRGCRYRCEIYRPTKKQIGCTDSYVGAKNTEVYEIRQGQGVVGLKMVKSGECGSLSFRGLHHLNPVGKVR